MFDWLQNIMPESFKGGPVILVNTPQGLGEVQGPLPSQGHVTVILDRFTRDVPQPERDIHYRGTVFPASVVKPVEIPFLTREEFEAIEAAVDAAQKAFVEEHGSCPRIEFYKYAISPAQKAKVDFYWRSMPGNYSWINTYDKMRRQVMG